MMFKVEAVKQVTDRGHAASEVAARLRVSAWSLHRWITERQRPEADRIESQTQSVEIRRLKAELKRVTEERDILKNRHRERPRPLEWKRSGIKWCFAPTVAVSFLEA